MVGLMLTGCVVAEPVVVGPPPPPPARVEVVPAQPGPAYVWVPGHRVVPAAPPHVWVPGYWAPRPGGYVWIEGHWRLR